MDLAQLRESYAYEPLDRELPQQLTPRTRELLLRVRAAFAMSQTKALKEDLLAVRESGGLLGQVVCVRKAQMSEVVVEFARHNRIEVISKHDIHDRFGALLFPEQKAKREDLQGLQSLFGRR